jgi:NAD(P)-dependent dehydrogenase (short-subunit alcohol dehydrogenase family)
VKEVTDVDARTIEGRQDFQLFDADQFRGKVVVVTGAGRGSGAGGIGYNAALQFARAGARLAIIGRTAETLERTEADLRVLGAEVVAEVGDVSDPAAIERLFETVDRVWGRVDILINNAGVSGEVRALPRIPARAYRYAFDVHLHTLTTTRLAARLMRRQGIAGTILNIGTYFTSPHRQILRPYPFRTPYTGAQAWKLEHSRVSAWELAKDGIRVIALNLGPVEGGRIDAIVYPLGAMERGLWGRDVAGADIRRKTEEMHPAGRFLTQEQAARSILALASEELRDSANGTVVELAGGVDYRVPPQVAPPVAGGRLPELAGRRALIVGRPTADQAAALTLAFSACGARVVLGTPEAGRLLRDELAAGRRPEDYSDGQKQILGRARAIDLEVGDEAAVARFFAALAADGEGTIDMVVVCTGDTGPVGAFADLDRAAEETLKARFAFEPAALLRHAMALLLAQGNRRARIKDERFLEFGPFLALLERQRGVAGRDGNLQRIAGGWTPEEEATLQSGARRSYGGVVMIGPAVEPEATDGAPATGVVRAGLQAMLTSAAMEMTSARSGIRINAIFPGSDAAPADAARAARLAVRLAGDERSRIAGMVYHPDERNASAAETGTLSGRTAVVTGGGRNLGQAIALRLARDGARVVLSGRGKVDLDLTARTLRALGTDSAVVGADISFPGDRQRIIEAARSFNGHGEKSGVDLWVNNAGIGGTFAALPEIELDGEARWHHTLAVDFTGAWLGMVRAIVDMRRRGVAGGVVNVSTFYADQPYVFRLPYTVPKVLLKTCAGLLADRLRPYGLFIADIQPSLVDGPRFQWVAKNYADHFKRHGVADPDSNPAVRDWFRRLVPDRAPRPSDVADAVAFAAQRGLTGSGMGIAVSTLPSGPAFPGPRSAEGEGGDTPRRTGTLPRPGRTAVILATARRAAEIDRIGALAAWCLEQGSERVLVAGDDATLDRLGRRLAERAEGSPWWNLPVAASADSRLEIRGVEPSSAASLAELFDRAGAADTIIHAPGDPGARERFVLFPADADLADLSAAAMEARYHDHQRSLSLFLDRRVTAALLVARQAARSLAPSGTFLVARRRPATPEAALAAAAEQQIVRTADEEFRLLGRGLAARWTTRRPPVGRRLAALRAAVSA